MKGFNSSITWWCFFVCFFPLLLTAQSRKELEIQRQKIIQDIEKTSKQLQSTQKSKETQLGQLKALEEQVESRKKLIGNLNEEVRLNEQIIIENQAQLDLLLNKNRELQNIYSALIRQSYLRQLSSSKWSYLLSSENLNEFLLRWRYMSQFDSFARQKSQELVHLSEQIQTTNKRISEMKDQTLQVITSTSENMTELEKEQKFKDAIIRKLSREELALRDKLAQREKERENLNNAIEKIIRTELARAEKLESSDAGSASRKEAESTGFAQTKGKWDYPVKNSKISSRFGDQPHPSIKGVMVSNNGIDFSSSQPQEIVCVFDGEVVGVTYVPGFRNMVIVKHGSYYTVYSKLEAAYVSRGDKVLKNQKLGKISQGDNGQIELHFELWKDKNKLDPQPWFR
jgi:septal ring factor EnvC (AmiA/AmiB activator)